MSIPTPVRALLARRDGSTRVALVGASEAPHKFGNIILRDLLRKGFTVLPIHPTRGEIDGLEAYPTVADAPGPIHIVDVVVPPRVALQVLRGLDPDAIRCVWLQPGASDRAVTDYAAETFEIAIDGPCIMVEAR